jgi:hypothetical protein
MGDADLWLWADGMDESTLHRAAGFFVNGLIALALSMLIWRLTGNVLGWAVLFGPGAALVIRGIVLLVL